MKKQDAGRAAVVDELGRLDYEIDAAHAALATKLEKKMVRAEMLRDQVQGWYDKADAATPQVAEGAGYVVTLSARPNVTTITNMLVVETLLGRNKFRQTCKVGIGELRKLLNAEQLGTCTKTVRSGARSLAVVKKEAAATACDAQLGWGPGSMG